MTTFRLEGEPYLQQNPLFYKEQITKVMDPVLTQFENKMRSYVKFNMIFLIIGLIELLGLIFFFTFLARSSLIAFALALVFLTSFSYFILRLYYQAKKPEQYSIIKSDLMNISRSLLGYQEGIPEYHIAFANACCKLAESLKGKEYTFYPLPQWLEMASPHMEKFSCWWHWYDVHCIKELLLMAAIEEHIKLVKCEPTSLEAHASLANAYVLLSGLYAEYSKNAEEEEQWSPGDKYAKIMEEKFRTTAECAIEEFKILGEYAPNDPWVHVQLAYSYRDLQMPLEEIKEYEIILKLNSDDMDTLYKLGVLYFQLGRNAQGLKVYERLKAAHYKKAEMLIKHYGSFLKI